MPRAAPHCTLLDLKRSYQRPCVPHTRTPLAPHFLAAQALMFARLSVLTSLRLSASMSTRASMWAEVASGSIVGAGSASTAGAGKLILGRGCDPVMAARSNEFLKPLLSGASSTSFTDDDAFFGAIAAIKAGAAPRPDVVFFAPGAHRWSDAGMAIPGGNAKSQGWGIQEYHEHVRDALGDIPIVGSAREADVVPLLRKALNLAP